MVIGLPRLIVRSGLPIIDDQVEQGGLKVTTTWNSHDSPDHYLHVCKAGITLRHSAPCRRHIEDSIMVSCVQSIRVNGVVLACGCRCIIILCVPGYTEDEGGESCNEMRDPHLVVDVR